MAFKTICRSLFFFANFHSNMAFHYFSKEIRHKTSDNYQTKKVLQIYLLLSIR